MPLRSDKIPIKRRVKEYFKKASGEIWFRIAGV
jgi:hypothetical protein